MREDVEHACFCFFFSVTGAFVLTAPRTSSLPSVPRGPQMHPLGVT